MGLVVRGTVISTPSPSQLDVREDHVVTVGDDGVIQSVVPAAEAGGEADVTLPEGSVLLPGLVDLHVHAPQWPQLGTGLDLPLEEWLFRHTFPLEARYGDLDFAQLVWDSLVPGLLAHGTTTAVYYSTIHEPATAALADACVRHGQRAFVGRVAMDHPDGTPDYYRDPSASAAVEASHRSLVAIEALGCDRVRPILTPRFIPSCTDALLSGLGELATATGALVQTHCSESDWEHAHVLERCGVTDSAALARFGLARDHTVLAHAGHLTAADRRLLAEVGAGVAHCPLSNAYFANAVFPVRRALDAGMRVGLGTDVAGGAEPGLLAQCAHAVTALRMLADGVDVTVTPDRRGVPGSAIDVVTAFWLATAGGAEVLGVPVGRIEPGHRFDALAVATGRGRRVQMWPELDDWPRLFERMVRCATAADITDVWVDGTRVAGA